MPCIVQPIPGLESLGHGGVVGILYTVGDLTVSVVCRTRAPPFYHGCRHGCCGALEGQRVASACAREQDEYVGVVLVVDEVAAGEHPPVQAGVATVSAGGTMH